MPLSTFFVILFVVVAAAGVTVWLISMGGPTVMIVTLPAFMIAAVALKVLRK
jgi:hypothetical protein